MEGEGRREGEAVKRVWCLIWEGGDERMMVGCMIYGRGQVYGEGEGVSVAVIKSFSLQ